MGNVTSLDNSSVLIFGKSVEIFHVLLTKSAKKNIIYDVFLHTNTRILIPVEEEEIENMIEGYLTVKETAEKWGITRRRVQILCSEGKIPKATKFGHEWAIPADTERPTDGRITTGEYRNWRKKDEKI